VIIDAHAHYVPPAFLDEVAARKRSFPSVKVAVADGGHRFAFAGNDPKRPVPGGMSDADARKRWLAARSIDRQVVGGWLDLFGYDIPADEGADWSRYLNTHMLAGVKPYPFLVPLATVPLQSGRHAAKVLEEALDAGFPGAMIGTQPKGTSGVLDDPDLEPFWEAASRRKATLFVHPTFGAPDQRLKAYGLVSAVGRVTDTTIALSRLLYSGHLVRYPDVKLVISHGGAALPMCSAVCAAASRPRRRRIATPWRASGGSTSTPSSTTPPRCASSASSPAMTASSWEPTRRSPSRSPSR
jgi:aminocarboxymuconate-semialdehyde decarboxylase